MVISNNSNNILCANFGSSYPNESSVVNQEKRRWFISLLCYAKK